MSTIDIRNHNRLVEEIVFADSAASDGSFQAYRLIKQVNELKVYDGASDYVYVNSEEHARNLIKALEKAIELGWVK